MQFRILGPLEVEAAEGLVNLARRRERWLLQILALEAGQAVPADRLAHLLWEGEPHPNARRFVQSHIARIKSVLAGARFDDDVNLTSSPAGYRLQVEPGQVDAWQFRRLLRDADTAQDLEARSALLRLALDLWRAPMFGEGGDWLRARLGASLEELHLDSLQAWLAAEVAIGRHHHVLPDLASLTAAHPDVEGLAELRMVALHRAGRRSEALAVFDQSRRHLTAELGLDPSAALGKLQLAILRDEAIDFAPCWSAPARADEGSRGRATPRPNQLPLPLPDFTGRLGEQSALLSHLDRHLGVAARRPIVVIIAGMGGVGKTTLAVQAARDVLSSYPDGCLFADLRGNDPAPTEPHQLLGAFLRSLGMAPSSVPTDPDERLALYRSLTAGLRLLVVLDNAEDERQTRPLLPAGDGCAALVTSRRPLMALDGATSILLQELSPAESLDLLCAITGSHRVAADPDASHRVVALCGGLPLAVRIAGARITGPTSLTMEGLAIQLADERRRLDALVAGDHNVRACLDISYRRLSSGPAENLRMLAHLPTTHFTEGEATALSGLSTDAVASQLSVLVEAQLVSVVSAAGGLHRLHDLVRAFAYEQSAIEDPEPAQAAAIRRLTRWYTDAAWHGGSLLTAGRKSASGHFDSVAAPLRFQDKAAVIAWFELSRHNIIGCLRESSSRKWHEETWRLAHALAPLFNHCHDMDTWLDANELALAAAESLGDLSAVLEVRESIIASYRSAGRHQESLDVALTNVRLAEDLSDASILGRNHHHAAIAYSRLLQHDNAERHLLLALSLKGYAAGVSAMPALISLGAIHGYQHRYPEAAGALEKALVLAEAASDDQALCVIHHNLAELYLRTVDLPAAQRHARVEIEIAKRVRFLFRVARGYEVLGDCLAATSSVAAEPAWREAVSRYRSLRHPYAEELEARTGKITPA